MMSVHTQAEFILCQDANRCVSLPPTCDPTVELSVESKSGQSVLLHLNLVFE